MRSIYTTTLIGIRRFELQEQTTVTKNDYREIEIYDNLINIIDNNNVSIEGIKKEDLFEIEGRSNKKIIIPAYILHNKIYVKKTLIPNTVKEVVTGRLFKVIDYKKRKLDEDNIYGVDSYLEIVNQKSAIQLSYFKNYLLNSIIIRNEINTITNVISTRYQDMVNELEREVKRKKEWQERERLIEEFAKGKRLLEKQANNEQVVIEKEEIKKLLKNKNKEM